MGPDAFRCADLIGSLTHSGHTVRDLGNVKLRQNLADHGSIQGNNNSINLAECAVWLTELQQAAYEISKNGQLPIFLGGDHFMSAGTVAGVSQRAAEEGREQFVLWLDAHPDFHTVETTTSGNLHGTPVGYFTGRTGFPDQFPELSVPVKSENICMLGIRSVDAAEREALSRGAMELHEMHTCNEPGIISTLKKFLSRVERVNGHLHVSLDVDFLDPSIAPAVGTPVPNGATLQEAHLVMEILHESGLVTSLDLAELNPFLDERGRTATLMVDLVTTLMGGREFDRPSHLNNSAKGRCDAELQYAGL